MKLVGRSEKVYFPSLGDSLLSAKIDTGAYGNSMHAEEVSVSEGVLSFVSMGRRHSFSEYRTVLVKNSFGESQERYSVDVPISIGGTTYLLAFSLADRSRLKHPVLIGRRFLRKFGYFVDVRKKDINDKS